MTTISMTEFRRDADAVILKVQQGETVVLTDDGKTPVRLEPMRVESLPNTEEPNLLRSLCELGEQWIEPGPTTPLNDWERDREIDRIVYGL